MKYLSLFLAFALSTSSSLILAEETVLDTPLANTALQLGEQTANLFYSVRDDYFQVVVVFSIGSDRKQQPIRQIIQLEEDQTYRLSIGRYGSNTPSNMLSITRENNHILANVIYCESGEGLGECL
jgi:hypothetical protein